MIAIESIAYDKNFRLQWILNEFRLRFSQYSSILLFRQVNLLVNMLFQISNLPELEIKKLVTLELKFCCVLRCSHSIDWFVELYSIFLWRVYASTPLSACPIGANFFGLCILFTHWRVEIHFFIQWRGSSENNSN